MSVKVLILSGYGINADCELEEAFRRSGGVPTRVHVSDLAERPALLADYRILAFPGGFSFGDHLGSGQVLANLFRKKLRPEIEKFIAEGKLIIGICNGFQILVKMGVLPNIDGDWKKEVSLVHNDSGGYEDSWVSLSFERDCPSVWTKGLSRIELPIRHGEGRFVASEEATLDRLDASRLVAIRYAGRNPNGSERNIAGISDKTGRIFGLMPHPEAYLLPENHPRWTRGEKRETGLAIFRNGIEYFEKQN
jgi:phosphoribosylformylglycinamidine synthase I